MGLLDTFFGSAPEVRHQDKSLLEPWQKQLTKPLTDRLEGPTHTPFGGQLSTGPNNVQNLSLQALEQQAMDRVTGSTAAQDATMKALLQMLQQGQQADLDYQQNVSDPLRQEFFQDVLPGVDRKFAGGNRFSTGERHRITNDAIGELELALTKGRGDVINQTRDRSLRAAGMIPELENMGISGISDILQAGDVTRRIEQEGLDRTYQEFLRGEDADSLRIQEILKALGIKSKENIVENDPGSEGLLGGFLGSAGAGSFLSGLI